MHYLAHSITKLCSRKGGVFIVILECGYLSVCQRLDVSGLPTVRCEIIGDWGCDNVTGDLVQHDRATVDASLIYEGQSKSSWTIFNNLQTI